MRYPKLCVDREAKGKVRVLL